MPRALLPIAALLLVGATLACEPDKPDVLEAKREEAIQRADQARVAAREGAGSMDKLATPAGLDEETASQPVATLGGEVALTVGDVARYVARMPAHLRARYATAEQRQKLLQHMVELEVLAIEAERKGLDRHPRVQHALKEALARELLTTVVPTTGSVAEIPEEDVVAWYEAHRDDFVQPERRRVALLMVGEEEEARSLRQRIVEAIEEQPRVARRIFGDFVREHTIDHETREARGDVGWFDREGRNAEGQRRAGAAVLAHAFELDRVGALSEPFELPNGAWAVLQLTNRQPRRVQDLDQVRFRIQSAILQGRRESERERFIAALKDQADVEIHADRLDALPTDAPDEGTPAATDDAPGDDADAAAPDRPTLGLDRATLRGHVDLRPDADGARIPPETRKKLRLRAREVQEKMRPHQGEEASP